jgi:hypothetical protein
MIFQCHSNSTCVVQSVDILLYSLQNMCFGISIQSNDKNLMIYEVKPIKQMVLANKKQE